LVQTGRHMQMQSPST